SSSCVASATPSSQTSPSLGRSRPASSPSSVVLPDPEAPTIATDAPEATSKLTSSRIVNGSSPLVTILVKRAARRIGGTKRSELAEVRATRRVVSRFILREATRYGRARFAVAAGVSTIPSTIHAPYERKRNSMPTRRSQFAFFAAALLALLAAT